MMPVKNVSFLFTAAGTAMIVSALGLVLFNVYTSSGAARASEEAVTSFMSSVKINDDEEADFYVFGIPVLPEDYSVPADIKIKDFSEINEPVFEKDGISFLSVLEIPSAGIELPVCSDFSMELMKSYPCRYSGTAAGRNLIIAAHNYDSHFGRIKNLQRGDRIAVTDAEGDRSIYEVAETEVLPGNAVDEMKAGEWDLTLFTCDLSGKSRITVRCVMK